jgi:hypothetical protein
MRRFLLAALLVPAVALGQTAVNVITTDTIQSGCTLGSLNATCTAPMRGKSSAGFVVTAVSSPTGITLIGEVSRDGTNWGQRPLVNSGNETRYYSLPNASLAVGTMRTITMGGGERFVRVRASAWTSGSVTVAVTASDTADAVLEPNIGNAMKPTYVACSPAEANTSSSSALACEAGASKQFRVRALWVPQPGSQTTAGNRILTLRRTTSAGSGGTGLTPAPVDAVNDGAFSGVCRTKGTAGTAGTTLLTRHMWVPTAVANLANPLPIWPPYALGGGGGTTIKDILVDAGTANGIEVNDAGASGGANFYICIALTEE